MSVIECVSAPPGKILQIWCLQPKWLSQQEPPRNYVLGTGLNAPIFFSWPEIWVNSWKHRTFVRMSTRRIKAANCEIFRLILSLGRVRNCEMRIVYQSGRVYSLVLIPASSVIQQGICVSPWLHISLMGVLECVSGPPDKILQVWYLQPKWLSQQDPHRNSVQEPGPNAPRSFTLTRFIEEFLEWKNLGQNVWAWCFMNVIFY